MVEVEKKEKRKSSEIDGLPQEITKLNQKIVEMKKVLKRVKAMVNLIPDDEKKKFDDGYQSKIEMLKELKKEIEY